MNKRVVAAALIAGAGLAGSPGCAAPFVPRDSARLVGAPADVVAPAAAPFAGAWRADLPAAVSDVTTGAPAVVRGPHAPDPAGFWRYDPAADQPEATQAGAAGADSDQDIAKKLSNPIASLISMPLQSNWDSGMGPDGRGRQYRLNVQPVIPISLNEDWNLISRTILPVIDQHEVVPGTGDQSGIGDITQSLFFSPKEPTGSGWIWGAGPVFLVPTAGDDQLGAEKWGAGPTAVFLRQQSGWTYGALVNHIWSFAGNGDRDEVNLTYVQPFLSYTTPDAWTFGVNSEATYDWPGDDLGLPINLSVSKLVRIGSLPVQFQVGARYWAERTENGPQGLGFRFTVTFLLPSGADKRE